MEKLRKNDWRRKLQRGDEVTWNDPDEGLCTRTGKVLTIEYLEDDCAKLTMEDGWHSEVRLQELS
jgi:hypothetical protein